MADVLCVECDLPLFVSLSTNNQVVAYDSCGHLAHRDCAEKKKGSIEECRLNPHKSKCPTCRKCVATYCVVFMGNFDHLSPEDAAKNQVSADLRQKLDKLTREDEKTREQSELLARRKTDLAAKYKDLSDKERQFKLLSPGYASAGSKELEHMGDAFLSLVNDTKGQNNNSKSSAVAPSSSKGGKKFEKMTPNQLQGEMLENWRVEKILDRDLKSKTNAASAARGGRKQKLKQLELLSLEFAALQSLKYDLVDHNNDDDAQSLNEACEGSRNGGDDDTDDKQQQQQQQRNSNHSSGENNNNNNNNQNQNRSSQQGFTLSQGLYENVMSNERRRKGNHAINVDDDDDNEVEFIEEQDFGDGVIMGRKPPKKAAIQAQSKNEGVDVICLDTSSDDDEDGNDGKENNNNMMMMNNNNNNNNAKKQQKSSRRPQSPDKQKVATTARVKSENNSFNSVTIVPSLLPMRRDRNNNHVPRDEGLPPPQRRQLELAIQP